MSQLNADKTDIEVLVMGIPQMGAKISILCNTVNGVRVPVLNEPVGNMGAVLFKIKHDYVCKLYIKSYQACKFPP